MKIRPPMPRTLAGPSLVTLLALAVAAPAVGAPWTAAAAQAPGEPAAQRARPQIPLPPLPYVEEEVTVVNPADGVTLAGTLTLPVGAGPFPAVLLVSGSGTQDRDYGNYPWNHPTFRVLADQLTRQGLAVLRMDDRGIGGSGGKRSAGNDLVVGDAVAALALLGTRSEIDATRVGMVGHSWGGMVAALAAARAPDVRFLIALAGPFGMKWADKMAAQRAAIATSYGGTEEQIDYVREHWSRLQAAAMSHPDSAVAAARVHEVMDRYRADMSALHPDLPAPSEERWQEVLHQQTRVLVNRWYVEQLHVDPADYLPHIRMPVLGLTGSIDMASPPELLHVMRDALAAAGNRDVSIEVLPNINHFLQTVAPGGPETAEEIEETVAPVVVERIVAWLGQLGVLAAEPSDRGSRVTRPLRPGEVAADSLPPHMEHVYTIALAAGQAIRVEIEPYPEYDYVKVHDPAGAVLAAAWVSCHQGAACVLSVLAESGGDHRLVLRPAALDFPAASPGVAFHYRVGVESVAAVEAAGGPWLEGFTDWLRSAAVPLAALEAGAADDDLLPLRDVLRDVRVVGLGEGTHGTREFFQLKHRLLDFLVRTMGFTHFAMELDEAAAQELNDYVVHGRGDAAGVLARAGMWQWDTEEVAALLEWMRRYNDAAPAEKKVAFAGFDFQLPDRSVGAVTAFLRRASPGHAVLADSVLAPLVRRPDAARPTFFEFYGYSPEQKVETAAAVGRLHDVVAAVVAGRAAGLAEPGQDDELQEVLDAARRLVQFVDAHSRDGFDMDDPDSGVAARDRYMAENAARILERAGPDARIVLWSHNEHVRRDAYSMGHHLGERYGDAYYALGFAFDRGGFRALEITGRPAPPLKDFLLPSAFQGTVGWYLRRAELGDLFLDLRAPRPEGPAREWAELSHPMRSIGNGYAPSRPSGYYRAPVIPGVSYDGLVFIERTTPARGNSPAGASVGPER
jgi:erythromycin esterase